jgi:hypothetical protein
MDFIPSELTAVSGARELEDRHVVTVELGLPVAALLLAKTGTRPQNEVRKSKCAVRRYKRLIARNVRYEVWRAGNFGGASR